MKNKLIPNFSKVIFITAGLIISLFVSTLMADLLLFGTLSLYSHAVVSLLVGMCAVLLFIYITRLHAVSLSHASILEIARVGIRRVTTCCVWYSLSALVAVVLSRCHSRNLRNISLSRV